MLKPGKLALVVGGHPFLDAGGGLGVPFTASMDVPDIADYLQHLDAAMSAAGFDPATEPRVTNAIAQTIMVTILPSDTQKFYRLARP